MRSGHDAGAVDQDVPRPAGGDEPPRERVDRPRVEQIHRLDPDAVDAGQGLGGPLVVAGRNDDGRARAAQCPDGLHSDAGVATGDDGDLAGQVDAVDDFGGRGRCAETGADRSLGRGAGGVGHCGLL
jgi:hypothetical protein